MANGDALVELAVIARREGRLKECADRYQQAADTFDSAGELMRGAHAKRHAAEVLLKTGDADGACAGILAVLEFYRTREVGRLELANTLRVAGLAEEGRGEVKAAREFWMEARGLYAAEGIFAGVAEADRRLTGLEFE
jgi:tetratricopeptide (TPR) repeat protein